MARETGALTEGQTGHFPCKLSMLPRRQTAYNCNTVLATVSEVKASVSLF